MAEIATSLPPPPKGGYLQWVVENPAQVAAYLATVYALQNLEITVTKNNVTTKYPIRLSSQNAVIAITV